MPRATWIQSNFNGGEWSPLAYGRFDIAKYKNGLAVCKNFMPTQQGGLTRRPGTRYAAAVKDSTYAPRLQRFEFSTTQAYVLEFGDQYIRFYTNDGQLLSGGVPYEVATPYSSTEVWQLNFAQSADTLYIVHPGYAPRKLQRAGATSWTLSTISFLDGPYQAVNSTTTTLTPSGTSGTVNVVASATTGINGGTGFRASDVGRPLRIKCGGVWLWGTIASRTDSTHITWTITAPSGSQVPTTATATANISGGSVFSCTITNGGGGYGATPPGISFSGGGGAGAVAYATLTDGVVTGITMSVTGTGYGSAPAVTIDPPTAIVASSTAFWRLGIWNSTDGYPSCVTFHQDRLVFAGTTNYPSRVDASNSGDYENFAPTGLTGTVVDSNALAFTLNSNAVNAITWLVSDEWGLLIGTTGAEWVIAPSNTQQAITPSNVNAKPLSSYGSNALQPVRVGKATLFVQRTGRKLRELFYQFTYNTFQAVDISLISEHLTMGGLKQMALQLAPQQIVWIVRTDGTLIGMTYDRDQEVCGWHQHALGGYSDAGQTVAPLVESVASIPAPGTQRDEVWVVVKRYINGAVVRTVEVMAKMWEDGDSTPYTVFLDSSSQYDGVATTTISGLTWLKGQTVGVLTNGATHPDCTVSASGTITLVRSATVVQVGLKYTSSGQTLPIEAGGGDGPSQGKLKRVYRSVVRFFQSVGISMGSAVEGVNAYPQPWRTSADLMDNGVSLFDGDKRWSYEGTWDTEGKLYFETSDPLPCNITMLMAQLETQDAQ